MKGVELKPELPTPSCSSETDSLFGSCRLAVSAFVSRPQGFICAAIQLYAALYREQQKMIHEELDALRESAMECEEKDIASPHTPVASSCPGRHNALHSVAMPRGVTDSKLSVCAVPALRHYTRLRQCAVGSSQTHTTTASAYTIGGLRLTSITWVSHVQHHSEAALHRLLAMAKARPAVTAWPAAVAA